MTITNGYATLAEFKQRFSISTTDSNRDADIEKVIEAVSRLIDYDTGTQFYASSAGVTRVFSVEYQHRVYIDDCASITAVKLDLDWDGTAETTLTATTDYLTGPANSGPALAGITQWIDSTPWSTQGIFPVGNPRGMAVTATWGNTSTAAVDLAREATLLQANRIWSRRAAPFGVTGANEFGTPTTITRLDPDVIQMLMQVTRRRVW